MCVCVCVFVLFISSLVPPTLDYAEQLRVMQKTKDKLELALEKHQDCTYLLSPPVSLLLSSVTHIIPLFRGADIVAFVTLFPFSSE